LNAGERRISFGWTLALVLLILYFFFKIQGWYYAFQVSRLSDKIIELRPSISAIIRSEQVKSTAAAYEKAFQQVRQESLEAVPFLKELSTDMPASVTLLSVDFDDEMGLVIEGTIIAGVRSPEEALLPWAARLQGPKMEVRIRRLFPEPQLPGVWRFELKSQRTAL
jgi:Tfp pilus assembly protein PilN